jgi:hypothetical protein
MQTLRNYEPVLYCFPKGKSVLLDDVCCLDVCPPNNFIANCTDVLKLIRWDHSAILLSNKAATWTFKMEATLSLFTAGA